MDFKLFKCMSVSILPECSTENASCGGAKNQGSKVYSAFMMVSLSVNVNLSSLYIW